MNTPKRALITGASGGIGAEFAKELAARGVNLILAARRTDQLNILAEELRTRHKVEVEVITVDLTLENAHDILFAASTREGKTVDMLINNAGAGPYRPFVATTLENHVATLDLNIVSLTKITHIFAHHMQQHGNPSWIMNVASVASYQLIPNFSLYCGTKAYVRTFSEILNYELKQTNVSVSCLCPGGTATDFITTNNQKLKGKFGASMLMDPARVARIGVNGCLKGKRVIIPGVLNKIMCWIVPLLPNGLNLLIADVGISQAIERADQG